MTGTNLTHPDAVFSYKSSDMVIHVHSDDSYLSEPKSQSRVGGHYFFAQYQQIPPKKLQN